MLTRISLAWAPVMLSLALIACGSKGELVLPKESAAKSAPPPAPAPTAPSPAKQP